MRGPARSGVPLEKWPSLSVLMSIFPGEPGSLALLKLRMMEVVVTTVAISRAKLQSNGHHQLTNTQLLQAGCPSCRPTAGVKALKGNYHIPWTGLSQANLAVFQLCLWPLKAPGYLGGGLPSLSSACAAPIKTKNESSSSGRC